MQKNLSGESRFRILGCLFGLILLATFVILPFQFHSEAIGNSFQTDKFDYFDIRDRNADKESVESENILERFRQESNTDAVNRADVRDKFVRGENLLKQKVPNLRVEYNKQLRNPEVIAPDIVKGGGVLGNSVGDLSRAETLRHFAAQNDELLGLEREQISELKVTADYKNPTGELSFARLEQFIHGIPVFRGEIRAGFNRKGEMFRVVNDLASGLDYDSLSQDFGDPAAAIQRASGYLNHELKVKTLNEAETTDLKAVFGEGDWATTSEKMYFPIETGVARAAWRVLIWELGSAYYVIVDAETGALLYRENITSNQTQAATYNVYANTDSLLKVMPNPAPLNPNPVDPSLGTQGTLMPRSNVTAIGNEAPFTFNNLGWMNDGANGETDGNNVEAGVDRDSPNGVDATVKGTNRVFNFNYTPGAGANNSGGDDPLMPAFQNGAATNLFYITNRFHDETYLLGFTEQAKNFQNDNFGRGGLGNDRISAEAQDNTVNSACPTQPCVNNANFSAPADGSRGRMQMYIWNSMTPNRDGDLDAEVVVHELTHGLFGRLHNGVGGVQSAQMNEGNSDFFAHVMLARNSDPIEGVYATGVYVTLNLRPVFGGTANYYYGIRRFPKAVMSFKGGANNRPHNPLTYADIDPAQMDTTNGAFPEAFAGTATASHNGGEVWSSMLWEVRAKLIRRLGAAAGNKKILQLVMDGMKIAPSNPTMKQERDAILAAAEANGNSGDIKDVWSGFAVRGLGFSAQNPTGNMVVEAFDTPNVVLAQTGFSVSDAPGNNNGFPEPGEKVLLNVPLVNDSGGAITNVSVRVAGGETVNYGTINFGDTVSRSINYTVPANIACGGFVTVTLNISGSEGIRSETREFRVGVPIGAASVGFANITPIDMPNGQPTATSGSANPYPSKINVSGLSGTKTVKVTLNNFHHEFEDDLDMLLVGPGGQKFVFLSDVGGSTKQIEPITFTITDIANELLPDATAIADGGQYKPSDQGTGDIFPSPAPNSPYQNAAPSGSATFASVFGTDGANLNGDWSLYIYDDSGNDSGRIDTGWSITFDSDDYACSFVASGNKRADFDGDGKTDLSVFRPSDGVWYLNRSTAGFTATTWGASSDTLVPGDYDGDGKTDTAVFRGGAWYILRSGNNSFQAINWGASTDKVVPGDYDGDGKTDAAVFRPSNGVWYILKSGDGGFLALPFGQNGDVPAVGDYDGDNKDDTAVVRAGVWYINGSMSGFTATAFGTATDLPAQADYDGDGKTDIAVFRPTDGNWYRYNSSNGQFTAVRFGQTGDIPVPGDYDGDGKYDEAVVRSGVWYLNRSTSGFAGAAFGFGTDKPIPKQYIP